MNPDPQKSSAEGDAKQRPNSALERARRDMADGRPDLARDRLTGYLYSLHRKGKYQQEAYSMLGAAYFSMHDYSRAGAAWLLTDQADANSEKAFQAFFSRYGQDPVNILNLVKPHAPAEDYPPAVQARLKSWNYRYRPYRPRSNPHVLSESPEAPPTSGLRPIELGCAIAALGAAIVIIYWIWLNIQVARGLY